ncbi:hypothetical protein [Actinomadura sp. HBU206391]|uniref:hypothetical protein n=1 Tax=Actinomadura sp. HBU206391 TaxID=2731692 RepID=UPI00164F2C0E|nr:hypothetical protein [Actinomadura sp. HBU206391]MBC6456524.1 hypothetical protein [Actinomadura sp. HBU206391]
MTDQHTTTDPAEAPPGSVDDAALLELTEAYHERTTRFTGVRALDGHQMKVYVIEAPGREAGPELEKAALDLAADRLRSDRRFGALGLGCLIVHLGEDGDYVLVHSWVEGYMSRLSVFTGPADRPGSLRPAQVGLAPSVWEAAVLAQERDAYVRNVLTGRGPLAERLRAWREDVLPKIS